MFRHYLRTALRFLKGNKLYALINVLGLSISLAVSFTILLYVINEFSFDHCHKNRKQVYRVISYHQQYKYRTSGTPFALARTLKEDFPQVKRAVNVGYLNGFQLKLADEYISVSHPYVTDSEVFDILTIPMIGSLSNDDPLKELNSIVISKKLADIFFSGEDPVGREMYGLINDSVQLLVVNGVFEDFPENSTLQADCFLNGRWILESLMENYGVDETEASWLWELWTTWILFENNADVAGLEAQLEGFVKAHISDDPEIQYSLQSLSDVHLHSADIGFTERTGDLKNIRLFSTAAVLILLLASINYIILSNAISTGRAREIGIRKIAGASIMRIQNQVFSESIILSLMVLPVALLLMWLAKPAVEKLLQIPLDVIRGNVGYYIMFYLLLTILIGFVSGLYASSYLSRMKVVDVLKPQVNVGSKRIIFRSSLIVVQLVIFCSFVAGTLIIRSQYQYAINRDPGYNKRDMIKVELGRGFQTYDLFLERIHSIPEVIMAAGASNNFPERGWMTFMQPHFQDKDVEVKMEGFAVDYDFLETLGITVLEGRTFSTDYGDGPGRSVILNETAVRELGIEDPVGQFLQVLQDTTVIIGVIKDFNYYSIHKEIPPMVISLDDKYHRYILVHYRSGTLKDLVPKLKEEWLRVEPDQPFRSNTLEELLEEAYRSEKNLGIILSISAIFAILIASFGLFGLTLFVARSRKHEIGIKKVFGSTEGSIVYSFLRSNFLMVLVAEMLSIPVVLYFLGKWLNNFPYRTGISWWVFMVAFIIATLVVLLTVSIHAIKASRINPANVLRYE